MIATDEDLIRNLLSRCSRMLDSRDFDGWVSTFTENGAFNDTKGRSALLAKIGAGDLARDPALTRVHSIANADIVVKADTATCVSDLIMFERRATEGPWTVRIGRYVDLLEKDPRGRWLFASRRLEWLQ